MPRVRRRGRQPLEGLPLEEWGSLEAKKGFGMVSTLDFARRSLRLGSALPAIALLGAGCGTMAFASPAYAQDYTNVTAAGRVTDTAGKALVGARVQMRSNDQGFTRDAEVGSDGSYRVPQLPPGTYTFTISADGYDTFVDDNVAISQSQSGNSFRLAAVGAAAPAAEGGDIVVTGARVQIADFDRTTTGAVINVGELQARVPVARSLRDVILLAPGTTQGSSGQNAAFANQTGISGSSFTENAYYVNGLNITEFRQGFAPVTVPFDFYDTVEVKTGGFQAEFGRSTGGVVNATTKRGSNEFHGSVLFNWEPNSLTDDAPNTYLADNDGDYSNRTDTVFQLSGPIIKDRLFFYGLYNARDVISRNGTTGAAAADGTLTPGNNRNTQQRTTSPFWGGKLDAILFEGHRLEGTYFNTTQTTNTYQTIYNSDTNERGLFTGGSNVRSGGENYVGRYTGTFAPWLTLSAAYGVNKNRGGSLPLDTTNPNVIDQRSGTSASIGNPSNSITTNDDKREFYRGDVDLYFKLLGSHHIRAGYDRENLTATQISTSIGGGSINYFQVRTANDRTGLPIGTQYLTSRFFENGGSFGTNNEAFYIQDSWSIFQDRISLQLGIRNDRFTNKDANGDPFYKSGDQWGPRLGFTADPFGDGRNKVFGSFGRYFVPIAANTNIRGAGRELDYSRFNVLDGVNANGSPIVGAPILTVSNSRPCPDTGIANCTVTSNGEVTDPTAFIAQGLKPQSLDEYIVGFERRIGQRLRVGLNFTYRKLGQVLEDVAIDQAAIAYCTAQGFTSDACGEIYSGFSQYVLVNPGEDASIQLLGLPDGTTPVVDFTAQQLGYPKARRTYKAVDVTFNREFDGVWSVQGSYTWSSLKGNYEGGAKSDVGQADTGATQDFDQPGLTLGSYGYLPGHRRHSFKLFGSYQLNDVVTLGANGLLQSPKKFGCIGVVPTSVDPFAAQYQAAGNFCQGVATQRGKSFESDWRKELNLTVSVRVPADFDASIRFDVFNVFNTKSALDFDEFGDLDSGDVNPNYRSPLVYQQPRSARIQFRVGF
ncbi:TonB-dependent receptor [Microvirga sp. SRT01]|uniref:TonB-dependent receptor n=1 Tax=Sphingomonas longa TaxID=2778730 RepID=A0ABS2DA45_9SPHN|nr:MULTISPECIES: TonB-dependent receptor [Alphaproteobacteria]MBM6577800.1 TonB-dependent receptor [Sphingomonas sp. BT552]MBR7710842.1 TonB-dependent receptor [Microvirga sp. SRT01]